MRGYSHLIPIEHKAEWDELIYSVDNDEVHLLAFARRVQHFFMKVCKSLYPQDPDLIYREIFGDLDNDIESQLRAFGWDGK